MTIARLGREDVQVGVAEQTAKARLGREDVQVGVAEQTAKARLGRLVVYVGVAPPAASGVVHGHRTGMAFRRR